MIDTITMIVLKLSKKKSSKTQLSAGATITSNLTFKLLLSVEKAVTTPNKTYLYGDNCLQ